MERCETCVNWVKIYVTYYGEYIEDCSPSRRDDDGVTEFGRCKEAIFRNDSSADEEFDVDDLAAKGKKMFVEDGEGYFAALYTHKDHCCKCWQRKAV